MDERRFWGVIALIGQGSGEDIWRSAVAALQQLSEEEIFQFDDLLADKLFALDTREHARYACLDDSEVSADGFLYARCVAVANGREFYEACVADPTEMPRAELETLLALPAMAYEAKTGRDYNHATAVSYASFSNVRGWGAFSSAASF